MGKNTDDALFEKGNGSRAWNSNFHEYGKGQSLGAPGAGEGFSPLDSNPIETPSLGGAKPPWPTSEQSGD